MLLKQGQQIFGFLEDGQLSVDFADEVTALVKALQDASTPKVTAKGEITLTFKFAMKGSSLDIDTSMKSKVPKITRASTPLFVTQDGTLSTDHPRQTNMQFDDEKVSPIRGAAE